MNGFLPPPTIIEQVRIVDPARAIDEIGTIIVEDGKIVAAGADARNQGHPNGAQIIDGSGLTAIPGLVDMRVHIGEPGAEHRETIRSAAAAAVAGGVTSLVMMPDTRPVIDDVALVEFVLRTMREIGTARIYPAAAITTALAGAQMTEIGNLRDAGAVLFTDGRKTIADAAVMRRAMTYARDFGALIDHASADSALTGSGVMNEGLLASLLGLPGIVREAELLPLERDLRLVRLTGARYHAAKISCAMSAAAIASAKAEGLDVTAGASINHLTLNENDIGEYRTFFKLAPPLRSEDDRRAMVNALADGTIDVICSDHDPQDVDTKRLPFAEAEDGAIGLETLLSAALRLHHAGDVPLMRLIDSLSTAPARRLGLNAGSLAPGAPADIAIVDLDEPFLLDATQLRSKSKNTPFEDARLTGRVQRTIIGGQTVFALHAANHGALA